MSVFVDTLVATRRTAVWPHGAACHLYADTVEELHEMAGLLGLSRSWFQDRKNFPHYDLTAPKRHQAVARGALSADRRHVAQFMARMQAEKRGEGEPETESIK